MKRLILAEPRGFCNGVKRAIEIVEDSLKKYGTPLYVNHEIVHNRFVVNQLKEKGVIFVEDLEEVPNGRPIIYSAHGVSPEVRRIALAKKLLEIDATCPLVARLHLAVKKYAEKGYYILIIGHKKHREVIGLVGEAPSQTKVIESKEDLQGLKFSQNDKVCALVQTTFSLVETESIKNELLKMYKELELSNFRVCYATEERQRAVMNLIPHCDLIIVIGDPSSSNSNRLKEAAGVNAILINDDREIDSFNFNNITTVGLTAGASTPEELVLKCINKLKSLNFLLTII